MTGKFVSEDGRAFTDYRPNCLVNKTLQDSKGLGNSLEYRKFLQKNAESIIDSNFQDSFKKNKEVCNCDECVVLSKKKF